MAALSLTRDLEVVVLQDVVRARQRLTPLIVIDHVEGAGAGTARSRLARMHEITRVGRHGVDVVLDSAAVVGMDGVVVPVIPRLTGVAAFLRRGDVDREGHAGRS